MIPSEKVMHALLENTIEVQHEGILEPCWEWQLRRAHRGHGRVDIGSGTFYVHRLTATYHLGVEIPDGQIVRHFCSNAPCCNPVHLLLGTKADNNKDRLRANPSYSIGKGKYKQLNIDEVLAIKLVLRMTLGKGVVNLASRYGVGVKAIQNIRNGITYKNIKLPDASFASYDAFIDSDDPILSCGGVSFQRVAFPC